jgi:hypothetical protein
MLTGAGATLPQGPRDRLVLSLADADGQIVFHRRVEMVGQPLSQAERAEALPIQVSGGVFGGNETVGYLRVESVSVRQPPPPSPTGGIFLEWLSRILVF